MEAGKSGSYAMPLQPTVGYLAVDTGPAWISLALPHHFIFNVPSGIGMQTIPTTIKVGASSSAYDTITFNVKTDIIPFFTSTTNSLLGLIRAGHKFSYGAGVVDLDVGDSKAFYIKNNPFSYVSGGASVMFNPSYSEAPGTFSIVL